MRFIDISKEDIGKTYSFDCIITEIRTTTGPTILTLDDGSAHFKAVSFQKKDFDKQAIKARLKITQRDLAIESILEDVKLINSEDIENGIRNKIESRIKEKAKPVKIAPIGNLSKMIDMLEKASILIKSAVLKNRRIIIRYHADADGVCASYAIEYAIRKINPDISLRRLASRTPFYDYTDMIKDSDDAGLIIACDLGSNEQSELSFKKAGLLGIEVIVLDHHNPGEIRDRKTRISKTITYHLNPYIAGLDLNINTGIICTEIARLMTGEVPKNIKILPAIAGLGDRSKGDIFEEYIKTAKSLGYEKDFLKKIAEAIDFEMYYAKFSETKIAESLLGDDDGLKGKLVDLLSDEIDSRTGSAFNSAVSHLFKDKRGGASIYSFDAELYSENDYPGVGKITGMIKDSLDDKALLVLGIKPDMAIIRTNIQGFSVTELICILRSKCPDMMITGGGHDVAGAIRFLKGGKEKIISEIYRYVKEIMEKL